MISLCITAGSLFLISSVLVRLITHPFVVNAHNISIIALSFFSVLFLLGLLLLTTDLRFTLGLSAITAGKVVTVLSVLHLLLFWCIICVMLQTRLYFSLLSSSIKPLPIAVIFGLVIPVLIVFLGAISIIDKLLLFAWIPFLLLLFIEVVNYVIFKSPGKILRIIMQRVVRTTPLQMPSEKLTVVTSALLLDVSQQDYAITTAKPVSDTMNISTTDASTKEPDMIPPLQINSNARKAEDAQSNSTNTQEFNAKLKKCFIDSTSEYCNYGTTPLPYSSTSLYHTQKLNEIINFHTPINRSSFAAIIRSIKRHNFMEAPPISFLPHLEPTIFYSVVAFLMFLTMMCLCMCYKHFLRDDARVLLPQVFSITNRHFTNDSMEAEVKAYSMVLQFISKYRLFLAIHSLIILKMMLLIPVCNWNTIDVSLVFTNPVIFQVFAWWLESNRFGAPLAFLIDCYLYRQRPTYDAGTVNKIYTKWADMLITGILPCTEVALSEVEFLISQVLSAGMKKNHFNDMITHDNMLSIFNHIGIVSIEKISAKIQNQRGSSSSRSALSMESSFNQQLHRSLSKDFVINMDVFTAIEVELSIIVYICAIKFLFSINPVYLKTLINLSTLECSAILPNVLFRLDNKDYQRLATDFSTSSALGSSKPATEVVTDSINKAAGSRNYSNLYQRNLFTSLKDKLSSELSVELALLYTLSTCNPNLLFSAVAPKAIIRLSAAHKKNLFVDQITLISNISYYNMNADVRTVNNSSLLKSQNLIIKNMSHTRLRKNSLIGQRMSLASSNINTPTMNRSTTVRHLQNNTKLFSYFDSTEEKLVALFRDILHTKKLDETISKKIINICQLLDPNQQINGSLDITLVKQDTESENWTRLLSEIRNMKPFSLMSSYFKETSEYNEQLRALDEGKYDLERPSPMPSKLLHNSHAAASRRAVEDMLQLYSNRYPMYLRMPDTSQREFRINNTYYRLNSTGDLILNLQQRILKAVLNITVIRTLEYFETGDESAITLKVTPELAAKHNLECSDISLAVEYNVDNISKYICANIESPNFDVKAINTYTRNYGFTAIGYILAKILGITSYFSISDNSLLVVLIELESSYTTTLYHNKLHAADVAQMCMYMLSNVYCSLFKKTPKHPFLFVLKKIQSYREQDYETLLQEKPKHALIRPVDFLSLLFGSLCHDLGHTGIDNLFCINTENALALLYNDEAPLEHAHATLSWHILTQLAVYFKNFTPSQYRDFRALFLEIILATDMSTHFGFLRRLESLDNKIIEEILSHRKHSEIALLRWYILKVCIKFGDLSNPCRPIEISTRYAVALMNEFWSLGDLMLECGLEPDKIKTRPQKGEESLIIANSQIGFVNNIVVGFWQAAGKFWMALANVEFKILQENLETTVKHWEIVRLENETGKKK